MRRRSWPRLWKSCGGQVSPGGRAGSGERPGRRRSPECPVRRRAGVPGEAVRWGAPPGREGERAARRCLPSPPGAAGSRPRGGEGRRRLRPSADCGGRSESTARGGSAAPRRQPGIAGRARTGRCRRPERSRRGERAAAAPPHPLGPAYLRFACRRGGGSPGPAGRGACPRAEGRAFVFIAFPLGPQPHRRSCFLTLLCFRLLNKANFNNSLPGVTKSGLFAGGQRVPCGRSPRPAVCAARSRGARPRYLTGGPRGRLRREPRRTLQESFACVRRGVKINSDLEGSVKTRRVVKQMNLNSK